MNALFIGYGRMGSAIGQAWLAAGLVDGISVVDPHLAASDGITLYKQVTELPPMGFDFILVAVKPAYACEALAALPDAACAGAAVVSVAAGITTASLVQALRGRAPVVRAMPNTPVLVGEGCTVLYADDSIDELWRAKITRLFAAVGTAHWVQHEVQLNAVTAVSGSGPAYYHLFSEALAAAGVSLGLPPELAAHLAAQTARGAAALQTQGDADFASLRSAVTSPNGTTAAAIAVFEKDASLGALVASAAAAACRRSEELAASGP